MRASSIEGSGESRNDGSVMPRRVTARPPRSHAQVGCERGRADGSGPLAEDRGDDGDGRPVLRRLDVREERGPGRREQEVAERDETARDHDDRGVEDVAEAGEPEGDVVGVLVQQPERVGVARGGRRADVTAGDRRRVAAILLGFVDDRRALARRDELARHATQRGTRRDRLPVPGLAARAHRAVAIDGEVTDLGREAVRAAHDTAVEHDRAPDPGAERYEQRVARPGRSAEPHLAPSRDVGVVVDHDGKARPRRRARRAPVRRPHRGGSARSAARRHRRRDRRSRHRRPTPRAGSDPAAS